MRYFLILLLLFGLASCAKKKKASGSDKVQVTYMSVIHSKLTPEFNKEFVFFVDFSLPADKDRFFVIRLQDSMIISSGICCSGRIEKNGAVIYSNQSGSNCSSMGAYKIGASYNGKFGKAFKLYGLDSTNSNAYDRNIVLHAFRGMQRHPPVSKIYLSQGCPTVSSDQLEELAAMIEKSKKPIMLYIK